MADTPENSGQGGGGARRGGGDRRAATGGDANGAGRGAEPVGERRQQYMIAQRPIAGVAPMATDMLVNSLNIMPDVQVIRRIAPRGLSTLAAGPGGGEIIVAAMPESRGRNLQATAGPALVVEQDALLRHHQEALSPLEFGGSSFIPLPGVGTDLRFRIVGEGGKPLPNATIYVYGEGFPAQGTTDANGEVTVTVFGGPAETVQAIYVKPAANHWDRLLNQPGLSSGVNTIPLRPLSETYQNFPKTRLDSWNNRLMRLDQLGQAQRGQGIRIGIIDSGCDNTHPQLKHVTRGLDFTDGGENGWTNDTFAHGTHCAGTITAASDQVQGIVGFAPAAEVHVFKVFPGGRFSSLIDALDECIQREIDVVNLSLGSDVDSELVQQKLIEARQRGVACIVAAGNSGGRVQFPARVPGVLAVSAIGRFGEFPPDSYHSTTPMPGIVGADNLFAAKFSCWGPEIAVSAPGVAIVSTVPGGYAALDGTSMAAPHVTGFAALLLAHHPVFQSDLRTRNEQRVAGLFQLIGAASVPYITGAPLRTGLGLPDLSRVQDLRAGTAAPQGVGAPLGAFFGGRSPGAAIGAFQGAGFAGGLSPMGVGQPFGVQGLSPQGFGPQFAPQMLHPDYLRYARSLGWL